MADARRPTFCLQVPDRSGQTAPSATGLWCRTAETDGSVRCRRLEWNRRPGWAGAEPDNDKEAVSDVSISTGLDEPELYSPGAPRHRRFGRRPTFVPTPVRKPAVEITEGSSQGAVNLREGLYRRTLAAADALAAFAALVLVVVWDAGADIAAVGAAGDAGRDPRRQGRRALRARRARPEEDDARRGADAAADHRPLRPDRLPRPERLRPRGHDAAARRRAVAGQLLLRLRRPRGRPQARGHDRGARALPRARRHGGAPDHQVQVRVQRRQRQGRRERPAGPAGAAREHRALQLARPRQRRAPRDRRAGHDRRPRHAGPDPRRQVGRRAREPAAAPVRGRRLLRGVRPARRAHDARHPPLRPHPQLARAQARVRPRRLHA